MTVSSLLLIFFLLTTPLVRGNMLLAENSSGRCLKPALSSTVSVYYDSKGNKYVYVKGFKKKDGTFVKGYYRSSPDKDKSNNWSSKGNTNPNTGKKGYK